MIWRGEADGVNALVVQYLAHIGASLDLLAGRLFISGGALIEQRLIHVTHGYNFDVLRRQRVESRNVLLPAPAQAYDSHTQAVIWTDPAGGNRRRCESSRHRSGGFQKL